MTIRLLGATCLAALLLVATTAPAQEPAAADKPAAEAEAPKTGMGGADQTGAGTVITPTLAAETDSPPKLSDTEKASDVIKAESLPNIVINRKDKTVTIDGFICLREGYLELFACGNRIREHEAIVSLKARPLHVNVALMLLGLTPGNPVTVAGDGTFLPPAGPLMRIFVEWQADGKTVRKEAHELMNDADTEKTAKPQKWVFCGGVIHEGHFPADYEGTVVCVSNFATAILDLPFESSDKNSELMFMARTEALPPLGTEVKLILQATGEEVKGKKLAWTFEINKDGTMSLEGEASSLDDLKTKLAQRDKYVRTVYVMVHPEAQVGLAMQAMRVVSAEGLNPQLTEKVAIKPVEPDASTPDNTKKDEQP
ncbi:MAG: hypothetical protein JXL80_15745 [Planctomycetes bacterium]|nr:hypothetical protein [Planctomycetota bacterium]